MYTLTLSPIPTLSGHLKVVGGCSSFLCSLPGKSSSASRTSSSSLDDFLLRLSENMRPTSVPSSSQRVTTAVSLTIFRISNSKTWSLTTDTKSLTSSSPNCCSKFEVTEHHNACGGRIRCCSARCFKLVTGTSLEFPQSTNWTKTVVSLVMLTITALHHVPVSLSKAAQGWFRELSVILPTQDAPCAARSAWMSSTASTLSRIWQ